MKNSPFFQELSLQISDSPDWISVTEIETDQISLSAGLSGAHFAQAQTATAMGLIAVSQADALRDTDNRSRTLKNWCSCHDTFGLSLQKEHSPICISVEYIPLRCEECSDRCAVILILIRPMDVATEPPPASAGMSR